jgi:carboxyl-terminal processing protease
MSFARLRRAIIILFLIILTFSGGYFLGRKGFMISLSKGTKVTISRQTPPEKNLDFSLFWRVWDTLHSNYFDKTKLIESEMVYGAIRGMVSAIGDPYTVFLPPKENKVVQEDLRGSFEGVGIQIGFRGNQLAVIAPLPDSPAEEAGVEAGDFIVGIKDELKKIDRGTVGITLPEAVQAIRGAAGTKVTLTLLRNGQDEPIVVDIVRASLDIPSLILSYEGKDQTIAYVKLLKFSGESKKEWDKAVKEILMRPKVKGIVLDLRNNPGGYLQAAVDIASEFLKNGEIVVVEENSKGRRNEFRVERIGRFLNTPVVVMINKGSASASEILAGALRDVGKVTLVGETSFGKGTIQEPIQIENGAGLHITTARWLTPSGFWVNEKGLEPDVKIEDNPETPEDEQLLKAIELISN